VSARSWFEDPSEVARLFDWLVEHDRIDKDPAGVSYFLHKPWKWQPEYLEMLNGQGMQAVS
jgi:hypothetical protein